VLVVCSKHEANQKALKERKQQFVNTARRAN
jgi:hypothetical protein